MTEDRRPEAAKIFDPEKAELETIVRRIIADQDSQGWRDLSFWVDVTLAKHRMEARSEGLSESWRGTWWDRNWFGLAFLGMIAFALVMIGLVNGWS